MHLNLDLLCFNHCLPRIPASLPHGLLACFDRPTMGETGSPRTSWAKRLVAERVQCEWKQRAVHNHMDWCTPLSIAIKRATKHPSNTHRCADPCIYKTNTSITMTHVMMCPHVFSQRLHATLLDSIGSSRFVHDHAASHVDGHGTLLDRITISRSQAYAQDGMCSAMMGARLCSSELQHTSR